MNALNNGVRQAGSKGFGLVHSGSDLQHGGKNIHIETAMQTKHENA